MAAYHNYIFFMHSIYIPQIPRFFAYIFETVCLRLYLIFYIMRIFVEMYFEVYMYKAENALKPLTDIFSKIEDSLYELNTLPILPIEYIDLKAMQFRADFINRWLSDRRRHENSIIIGVLNIDAYVPPLNFVFGVATPYNMVATVYLPQLRYSSSKEVFEKRIYKEVLHEIGHLFGLGHCRIEKCVMSFSNSVYDVDRKEGKFCAEHYNQLLKTGLKIDEELMLRV